MESDRLTDRSRVRGWLSPLPDHAISCFICASRAAELPLAGTFCDGLRHLRWQLVSTRTRGVGLPAVGGLGESGNFVFTKLCLVDRDTLTSLRTGSSNMTFGVKVPGSEACACNLGAHIWGVCLPELCTLEATSALLGIFEKSDVPKIDSC
jgi:hypothetical protein